MSTRQRLTTGMAIFALLTGLSAVPSGAAGPLGDINVVATGGTTSGFTADAAPSAITLGPDGLIWFLERSERAIGRVNADGTISEFPWPAPGFPSMSAITSGPDGNLWFTDFNPPGRIGRVTPAGVVTEVATGGVTPGFTAGNVQDIVAGPDGNLWFTRPFVDAGVGRITPAGVVTQFAVPTALSEPRDIAVGSDGNLWVTDSGPTGRIWSVTTAGIFTEQATAGVTPGFSVGFPSEMTAGPDGALWFNSSDLGGVSRVTRITTEGDVTEFNDPGLDGADLTDITSACGSLWISQGEEDGSGSQIWRLTVEGDFTGYTDGMPADTSPDGVVLGPENDVWFTGRTDPGRILTIGTGTGCGDTPGTTTTTAATATPISPAAARPATAAALTPSFTG